MKRVLTTLIAVAAVTALSAQQPGFKRTVLQQGDLSIAGREAVTARADIPEGAQAGKHTHPGEEIGYILQGTVVVEIEGAKKTLKAGDAFLIPAGKVHNAQNAGAGMAQVLATYIVEKGKPLATPVQ